MFTSSKKRYYNLLMKTRVKNKRTNLGKMYFEKTYIIIESKINANITWFIKKKVLIVACFVKSYKSLVLFAPKFN